MVVAGVVGAVEMGVVGGAEGDDELTVGVGDAEVLVGGGGVGVGVGVADFVADFVGVGDADLVGLLLAFGEALASPLMSRPAPTG